MLENLYVFWYNPDTRDWETLVSSVNMEKMTVRGLTDHFSVFDVGISQWQAADIPTIQDFQVSTFTGAASYSLPLEVPAGPGGLQPSLTLSYNSQVVDQATTNSQASWVGMGWSLETGAIVRDTSNSATTVDDIYSLNMGGVSTRLVNDHGVYHAANENFWKYDYNSTSDVWTIRDKVGNTYVFGQISRLTYQGNCNDAGSPGIRNT